jgi:predicted AAA+ superfamily ATPase
MDNPDYRARVIDTTVEQYLQTFGAVCIEGPKWSGKTWTATKHAKSVYFVGDPAGNFQNRTLAQLDPSTVLEGQIPRLIDEWQEVPALWDAVRFKVDQNPAKGQYILTGSATPSQKGILHSGTGRIARLRMMTMSLFESGDSSGLVSLKEICEGNSFKTILTEEVSLKTIASLILRGGWPASIGMPTHQAVLVPAMYLNNVIYEDMDRIDNQKRNKDKLRLLLRSLARNESTTAGMKTLERDMMDVDRQTIDKNTVLDYLDVLARLFIIENQKPFALSLRSSQHVRKAEKRHFTDPSFTCSLLGIRQEERLIGDLETFGFLFEALCIRDLKIYAQSFGGQVYHYQDYQNNEIDAVIEMADGSWSAFEIKLGAHQIDAAAEGLKRITAHFERPPTSLCVICALSNAAYIRDDGVSVIPLTALRP